MSIPAKGKDHPAPDPKFTRSFPASHTGAPGICLGPIPGMKDSNAFTESFDGPRTKPSPGRG